MRVKLQYGQGNIFVDMDDERVAGVFSPNDVVTQVESDTLRNALNNPIDSASFTDFLSGEGEMLIIVNDGTRPTPTRKILDVIYNALKGSDFKFLIATGVHRTPTDDEFEFIFGRFYDEFKKKIFVHDSTRDDEMVFLGRSKNGTEMYLNRLGVDARKILVLGSVEPHYFAGYTGGRKAFLPGIAARTTIEQNHKYAMDPEAKALALDNNPVHQDMIDALKTIEDKNVFSIQTVLNRDRKIYAATSGHINSSFLAAINSANEVFCVDIKEKADIVVSVAPYPMDVDLYQSQKALDNGKLALKDNGILILVAKCRTGIGEPGFYKLLAGSDTPEGVLEKIDLEYKLGYHKAAKMAEIATWAEMWGVTGLEDEEVRNVFIRPFNTLQEAVDLAIEKKGRDAQVLFLLEGSITVPMI